MEELQIRPGDVIASKYRVEKVLGAGGMGMVFAARHVTLDNLVAIKVMQPRAVAVKGAVERFEREARAAAQLQSKHVMRVHDHGKLDSGAPYMVMEYLTGRDLAAEIEGTRGIPLANAAEYLLQACDAIAEAHSKGIVHRDLKPANLFLQTEPDGAPLIKVLDFGIAKVSSAAEGLTGTSQGMGSGGYMSPEQMSSAKKVDHRADIWALGVTLYELVTAQRPFEADSLEQFVTRVFRGTPTPLSAHRPDLPREVEAIILRCLKIEPDARFSSVAHFAHVLAPYAPPRAQGYVARIARHLGVDMPALVQPHPHVAAPAPAVEHAFGPAPAMAVAAAAVPPTALAHAQEAFAPTGPVPPITGASGPYPAAGASGPFPAMAQTAPSWSVSGPHPQAAQSGPYAAVAPGAAALATGPHAAVDARVSNVPASAPLVPAPPVHGAGAPPTKSPPLALFLVGGLLLLGLGAGGVWFAMKPAAVAEPPGSTTVTATVTTTTTPSQVIPKKPEDTPPPVVTNEVTPPASSSSTPSGKPSAGPKPGTTTRPGPGPTASAAVTGWTPPGGSRQ